mmetsp:Transcript_11153/g.23985  ORF Transcript_11153/g.23985 Transcript_11153/m.23985 type:complete len:489 (-) Transcript_11153:522-1988(-)
MLGNALLQSIRREGESKLTGETLAELKTFSLNKQEPICPCSATVMLPPGRTCFKFIVRGKELFARDQETCWMNWPIKASTEGAGQAAVESQEKSTIANYIDVKWAAYPAGSLPNPDPGSERPQPPSSWNIKYSIFRQHKCDDVNLLRNCFIHDWTLIRESTAVAKHVMDDMPQVRELIWAHFTSIQTLYATLSCESHNCFALEYVAILQWVQKNEIVPANIPESTVSEAYQLAIRTDGGAMATRTSFGKHTEYMVSRVITKDTARKQSIRDCGCLRHQFIQFLLILATRVFAPKQKANADEPSEPMMFGQQHTIQFDYPFEAIHHLLVRVFKNASVEYIHRDVFRRESMYFQDIINVFKRHDTYLRKLFDKHAIKGHTVHDFIPYDAWERMFVSVSTNYGKLPLKKIFRLSKSTFIDFEDMDFAPGLCYLEFLECLARLARFNSLAANVLNTLKTIRRKSILVEEHPDDDLAQQLENLLSQLAKILPA